MTLIEFIKNIFRSNSNRDSHAKIVADMEKMEKEYGWWLPTEIASGTLYCPQCHSTGPFTHCHCDKCDKDLIYNEKKIMILERVQ